MDKYASRASERGGTRSSHNACFPDVWWTSRPWRIRRARNITDPPATLQSAPAGALFSDCRCVLTRPAEAARPAVLPMPDARLHEPHPGNGPGLRKPLDATTGTDWSL